MLYELLIILIGWLYPAFATYNSLNGGLRAQISWIKYWIVFGVFNAFQFVTGCIEPWVPLLGVVKLCTLCWLLPSLGGGSQLIHDELFDPLLRSNKETINRGVESVCNMSSALLRELIKMIYHLLVDVVEQCWLMTRNADDIHVTPRLQAAINEVIAELRAARQAAIFMPHPQPAILSNEPSQPEPFPAAAVAPTTVAATSTAVSATTAVTATNVVVATTAVVSTAAAAASIFRLSDDAVALRVLLAEAASAQRMQFSQQLSSREHLAPIRGSPQGTPKPHRPPKPKHGKRKHHLDQQLELELDADRAYCEYCGTEPQQQHEHEQEREREQQKQELEQE